MLSLPFVPAGRQPLYLQLYQYIRSEAEAGHLVSGEKLPSKRQLGRGLPGKSGQKRILRPPCGSPAGAGSPISCSECAAAAGRRASLPL